MAALRRGGRCGGQERRSVVPGTGDRPEWVRYALPRHKRGGREGPGRARKLTRAGTSGVVDLSLIEFLDRLAALIPPPRKHWHLYHGCLHPTTRSGGAGTALAIGNIGKRQEAVTGGHASDGRGTAGSCNATCARKAAVARHVTDFLGETPGAGGWGVSARVPELRRRHPAKRVTPGLPVRNYPWPSNLWQPPVATDIRSASRGQSGKSSHTRESRSSRLRGFRLAGRTPSWASLCKCTTIARSSRPYSTGCSRSTFTASERRQTRGVEALGTADWEPVCGEARKKLSQRGVSGVSVYRDTVSRLPGRSPRGLWVAQHSGRPSRSANDRAILHRIGGQTSAPQDASPRPHQCPRSPPGSPGNHAGREAITKISECLVSNSASRRYGASVRSIAITT